MENYIITTRHNKVTHTFAIADYPHHNGEHCKYRVFEHGVLVAGFEPGAQHCLHVCQNKGKLDDTLLALLADKIEAQLPHPSAKHFR